MVKDTSNAGWKLRRLITRLWSKTSRYFDSRDINKIRERSDRGSDQRQQSETKIKVELFPGSEKYRPFQMFLNTSS